MDQETDGPLHLKARACAQARHEGSVLAGVCSSLVERAEAVPTAISAANLEQNASHSKQVRSPGPHNVLSPPAGTARLLPTPGLSGSLLRKPRSLAGKKSS